MELANFLNCYNEPVLFSQNNFLNCLLFSENHDVNKLFFSLVLLGPWETLYLIHHKKYFGIFFTVFLSTEAMLKAQTGQ